MADTFLRRWLGPPSNATRTLVFAPVRVSVRRISTRRPYMRSVVKELGQPCPALRERPPPLRRDRTGSFVQPVPKREKPGTLSGARLLEVSACRLVQESGATSSGLQPRCLATMAFPKTACSCPGVLFGPVVASRVTRALEPGQLGVVHASTSMASLTGGKWVLRACFPASARLFPVVLGGVRRLHGSRSGRSILRVWEAR